MKSTKEQKILLRKKIILQRKGMNNSEIEEKSMIITRKLLGMSQVARANSVLLYLPVNGEVDTKYLLAHFQKGKINIFLPAYLKEGNRWVISRFENFDRLETGPFGIMQPKEANHYNAPFFYLAIVPVVAFSVELKRLGYGKGVYDHLLGGHKTIRIGLAYEFQRVKTLPSEPHDVKMDFVVTEKHIHMDKPSNT